MAVPQRIDEEFNQRYQPEGAAANDSAYIKKGNPVSKQKVGVAANDASFNNVRYKTPDRTQQGIRNIRTESRFSSMPGSPRNISVDDSHPDIATSFNQEYAKKGIQPRNFDDRPASQPYQATKQVDRSAQTVYSSQPSKQKSAQVLKLKGVPSVAVKVLAQQRVTALNYGIWSWGIFSWQIFQIPMAILSIILLGIAMAFYGAMSFLDPTEDDGLIASALKTGASTFFSLVGKGADWFLSKFGVDVKLLDPINFFLMTHIIVFSYGIFLLLIIYLVYKLARLNPLSGKGGGLKMGLFLLAFIGYSIPLLNILPWFMPWTMVVWRCPK